MVLTWRIVVALRHRLAVRMRMGMMPLLRGCRVSMIWSLDWQLGLRGCLYDLWLRNDIWMRSFCLYILFFPVILHHHVERTETLGIYDTISSLDDSSLGMHTLEKLNI